MKRNEYSEMKHKKKNVEKDPNNKKKIDETDGKPTRIFKTTTATLNIVHCILHMNMKAPS